MEIEPGIDGLLHVNEVSWTKRVKHPNEVLNPGDVVKCVVLSVDQEQRRMGLGLKQLTEDPWREAIPKRYQPGLVVHGKVTKITNFGVFVELEDDLGLAYEAQVLPGDGQVARVSGLPHFSHFRTKATVVPPCYGFECDRTARDGTSTIE